MNCMKQFYSWFHKPCSEIKSTDLGQDIKDFNTATKLSTDEDDEIIETENDTLRPISRDKNNISHKDDATEETPNQYVQAKKPENADIIKLNIVFDKYQNENAWKRSYLLRGKIKYIKARRENEYFK